MPVSMTGDRHAERGTALVLIAVMLVFVGYILTLGMGPFKTEDQQDRIDRTVTRQKFLVSQLSAYAQRENKIPCPADPSVAQTAVGFGFSRGSPGSTDPNNAGTCDTGTNEGIVPFRTLGLEPYDAIDGWGHFMTYKVSPVLTDPFNGTTTANANIYMRCRRFPWFDDGAKVYSMPYFNTNNVYPEKAGFCCPPSNSTYTSATDLLIYSSAGAGTTINGIGRSTVNHGNINTMTANGYDALPAADGTQEIFAFAIISHGSNGVGAYMANGTAARMTGTAGTDEALNYTPASPPKAVDRPMMMAEGANHFDDIVIWRTQIGLMSELNNASCYLPWR